MGNYVYLLDITPSQKETIKVEPLFSHSSEDEVSLGKGRSMPVGLD